MQAFTIDAENNITIFASLREVEGNGAETETFSTAQELGALVAKWPGARLIEIWNSLPGMEPVQRFTSRHVAAMRIWKAIQHLEPGGGTHRQQVVSNRGSARKKASLRAPPAPRENRKTAQVIGSKARQKPVVARPGSKTAKVLDLLKRSGGATLKEILRATGWQAHSVRGFISGHLGKKMGLSVRSFRREGERVYALKG
jgi:hypothetical protein